ncbi:30S ribosomal protein S13 [Candidatus Peregrinibacteria bacterium]|nr:30S ribosomal protein S13 [Candidatus Peregrinibacteria bacterium]
MARIAGVNLPKEKRVEVGLTAIYGIGRNLSNQILKEANINRDKKVEELSENEIASIREILTRFATEGDLRRKIAMDIKHLQEIGTYRGIRHKKGLPVRGQRTRYNCRTRKGKRKTVANKKIIAK